MSLTQVFQFMHEESWASVTWSWTFAGWRVLNLGCTSDWTQHSSISGSKMACVNYAAFVIVIKNNHLCYILYYILVQTRMIWCLKYFFHILKIGNEKKKIQTSNRTMSTSILFVCRYERYFLSLYFLCPPVCMKFWPISGCNPFTQVHWFCRTDCWLYDLRYLDLKSCCLRLAFFPGAQLWLLSLWLWFAVGSNLPAGFSYVMQQAPLRARWGRPVMHLRYQIPMWSCTTAPWATSVFYTGRCRCQQTVECD